MSHEIERLKAEAAPSATGDTMNLIPAIRWLDRYDKWRDEQKAEMPTKSVQRFTQHPEKYLRLVQANAMQWCVGKTDAEIKHRVRGLLK